MIALTGVKTARAVQQCCIVRMRRGCPLEKRCGFVSPPRALSSDRRITLDSRSVAHRSRNHPVIANLPIGANGGT